MQFWESTAVRHAKALLSAVTLVAIAASGCRKSPSAGLSEREKQLAKELASAAKSARPPRPDASAPPLQKSAPEPDSQDEDKPDEKAAAPAGSAELQEASEIEGLILDELNDIAPAGPATAYALGVVLATKSDELRIARLTNMADGKKPGNSSFSSVDEDPVAFMPYARGPALVGAHAYWIAKRRLLRRRLDGQGGLEVLATDAREGTRVSALASKTGAVVAYIAVRESDEVPQAKLWLEGGKTIVLSPEGSGASSVSLTPIAEQFLAVSMDARTSMTPIHGRKFRVKNGSAELDEDVVMWVGASSQALSEIFAATTRTGNAWAFVPIERDVSHFALASLEIGQKPRMDLPVYYRPYPNGLDVAPVASATFCGRTYVAYARPRDAAPRAPSELELAELAGSLGKPMVMANARAFSNVSLAPTRNGAVLSYVADRRTWARVLRCENM